MNAACIIDAAPKNIATKRVFFIGSPHLCSFVYSFALAVSLQFIEVNYGTRTRMIKSPWGEPPGVPFQNSKYYTARLYIRLRISRSVYHAQKSNTTVKSISVSSIQSILVPVPLLLGIKPNRPDRIPPSEGFYTYCKSEV